MVSPAATSPTRPLIAARVIFVLILVALAALYLMAAYAVFPSPFTDSAPHIIPILNYKAGRGFGGVAWAMTRDYDPAGHRFLQYPPLFHMAVAHLLPRATVEAVYACLGWLAVATLALSAALMFQGAEGRAGRRRPGWVFLGALGLCAISTWLYLTPAAGRPESLSELWIVLAVLVSVHVEPSRRPMVAGIFLGLLAATQTVNAILFGLMYSVYAGLAAPSEGRPVLLWFKRVGVAAPLGLLVFAGCLALGPYPVGDTLRGIVAHVGKQEPGRYAVVTNYLSPSLNGSFYGLFFLLVLAGFLWLERPRLQPVVVLNLGLLLVTVWYFAIRASNFSYNVFAFVPVLTALAVRRIARLDIGGGPAVASPRRRLASAVACAVFILMSVGLVRNVIILTLYKTYGVSYAEAKARFTELVPPSQPTPVRTMYSLWPLATRFDHLYLDQTDRAGHPLPGPEPVRPLLLVHQWYGRWSTPPQMPGYRLMWNDFVERPLPRWFGVSLSATVPGYAFALYQPVDDPVAPPAR